MAAAAFSHEPVMAEECLSVLLVKPGGVYVDGTVGGAGHASLLLRRLGGGARLICMDRDPEAVEAASSRLRALSGGGQEALSGGGQEAAPGGEQVGQSGGGQKARVDVVNANFVDIEKVCMELGATSVDGILLDLGVSSHQLGEAARGFSFQKDAPLNMRMDADAGRLTAADVVNGYPEPALRRVLREYGEERWADRIAHRIAERRARKPFETTVELADEILAAIPGSARGWRIHPATRTFLAIRIEVNGELAALPGAIKGGIRLLAPGGRLCVLAYHSLEDRIVKGLFREAATACICPRGAPVCVCGHEPSVRLLAKKPARPSAGEVAKNPRARSAKLRAVEKIPK